MLNTVCQNTDAKNQMLKKCKHDLSSKKKTKEKVNMLQCPSSLKQMNLKMKYLSVKPSSYYKYRGDNLQHSVVNNNETQSRNSRAVALSTQPVYDSVHP